MIYVLARCTGLAAMMHHFAIKTKENTEIKLFLGDELLHSKKK